MASLPKLPGLANASEGTKKYVKYGLFGLLALLLGAFGLEATNNDFDLGSIMSGNTVQESKIERDEAGNLKRTEEGGFLTKILRDLEGNEVPEGTAGAKYTDEYNCDDFKSQPQAQRFFDKAGGVTEDTNRLDGDKDGEACESLPKGE